VVGNSYSIALCSIPSGGVVGLTNPRRVFSFFTLVASNGVLGAGIRLRGVAAEPLDLWLLALFVIARMGQTLPLRVAARDCRH